MNDVKNVGNVSDAATLLDKAATQGEDLANQADKTAKAVLAEGGELSIN